MGRFSYFITGFKAHLRGTVGGLRRALEAVLVVGVGDGRVVYGDVSGHSLSSLLAAVAALAGARSVHSEVRARDLT